MKPLVTFLFLMIAFCLSGQQLLSWEHKISPSLLKKAREGHQVDMMIVLSSQADNSPARDLHTKDEKAIFVFNNLKAEAARSQRSLVEYLDDQGIPYKSLFVVNSIRVKGNFEFLKTIALRKEVDKILDDAYFRFPIPVTETIASHVQRSAIEWGIERIRANEVWAMGHLGAGVVVGGQDTGYDWDHPALKQQYRGYDAETDSVDHNYNWHDAIHEISPLNSDSINPCGLNIKAPCDDHSHGTHTMGTMIGLDSANQIGVAPEAKWCGCRNMERGWGSPFTYLECFQWFLGPTDLNNENPDPLKAPHVINNSWGCPEIEGCDSTNWEVMNLAVNNLRLAGIVVVVSAGNSGFACSTVSDPAAIYEGSFTVGATGRNDTIAGFSSRGPVLVDGSNRLKPDVSAPGVGIRSARPGGEYGNASGTSMAGPHVAGVVALMISANPMLAGQVDTIESIIEQTAVPKTTDQDCGDISGAEIPNNTYGYGRIDALAAVEAALAFTVSTKTLFADKILVYPNPASDILIIETSNISAQGWIDITDMQGRVLVRKNAAGRVSFDMSPFPEGIYFYRLHSATWNASGKILKCKSR